MSNSSRRPGSSRVPTGSSHPSSSSSTPGSSLPPRPLAPSAHFRQQPYRPAPVLPAAIPGQAPPSALPSAPALYTSTASHPGDLTPTGPLARFELPYKHCFLWEYHLPLVFYKTDYRPTPYRHYQSRSNICKDGLWGFHEWTREPQLLDARSPYLAALAVPDTNSVHILARKPIPGDAQNIPLRGTPGEQPVFRLTTENDNAFKGLLSAIRWHLSKIRPGFEQARSDPALVNVQAPSLALTAAEESLSYLKSGDLRSYAQFLAMWRAHQRAVLELEAFINWWARYQGQHPPKLGLENWERRGVIFNEDELEPHWNKYGEEMGLPVYGIVDALKYDISYFKRITSDPLASRFSITPAPELSGDLDNLPSFCRPPRNTTWETFEMEARRVIPRSDGLPVFVSDAEANARVKAQNQRTDATLKALAEEKKKRNSQRYMNVSGPKGSLHRFFDTARPSYYPPAVDFWQAAESEAMNFVGNFASKNPNGWESAFFWPPPSMFLNKRDAVPRRLARLVELWPFLENRIVLARDDKEVTRLTISQWRAILDGLHFVHVEGRPDRVVNGRLKKVHVDYTDRKDVYRYGSKQVFGSTRTGEIVGRGGIGDMKFGRMGCGHPPTAGDFEDDATITAALYVLTEESIRHQLAACVSAAWTSLPAVNDEYGTYKMPSFSDEPNLTARFSPTYKAIEQITRRPEGSLQASEYRSWHAADSGERRGWIWAVLDFFHKAGGADEHFARKSGAGPASGGSACWDMSWSDAINAQRDNISGPKLKTVERLAIEAWWAVSFKLGLMPCALLPPLGSTSRSLFPKCAACRKADTQTGSGEGADVTMHDVRESTSSATARASTPPTEPAVDTAIDMDIDVEPPTSAAPASPERRETQREDMAHMVQPGSSNASDPQPSLSEVARGKRRALDLVDSEGQSEAPRTRSWWEIDDEDRWDVLREREERERAREEREWGFMKDARTAARSTFNPRVNEAPRPSRAQAERHQPREQVRRVEEDVGDEPQSWGGWPASVPDDFSLTKSSYDNGSGWNHSPMATWPGPPLSPPSSEARGLIPPPPPSHARGSLPPPPSSDARGPLPPPPSSYARVPPLPPPSSQARLPQPSQSNVRKRLEKSKAKINRKMARGQAKAQAKKALLEQRKAKYRQERNLPDNASVSDADVPTPPSSDDQADDSEW